MNMNTELKDLIDVALDGVVAVEDLYNKKYFSLPGDMAKVMMDMPGVISNLSDFKAEIEALLQLPNQTDLIAYAEQKFAGMASGKALDIVKASLQMIQHMAVVLQDVLSLKGIIEAKQ